MDRRFVGILSICVVISTVFTLFIIGESTKGITVVENIYPQSIYRSRNKGVFPFQYGVVFRQDYASIRIQLFTLRRTMLNETPEDFFYLPGMPTLYEMGDFLGRPGELRYFRGEKKNQSVTIQLLDFSGILDGFSSSGISKFPEGARSGLITSPDPTLVFALVRNESGFVEYYEGVRDFFLDRELLLSDMYIRVNDDVSSFTSSRMSYQPVGKRILDAPKGGVLELEGIERDDRLELGFSVNSAWVPIEGMNILQIMIIEGDLIPVYILSNFVG
jgi:hypothetical protein